MSKPKTIAQDSDAVVHDDEDIPGMVSEHVDREAYPEGIDDDTILIDVRGLASGASGDVPDDDGVDLFFDCHDEGEMYDSLILAGVYPEDAKIYAASIVASTRPTTFAELFGRGSIVKAACARRGLNLKGLRAMDLRTMHDSSTPGDFNKKEHRYDARRLQSSEKQAWLIGSPPCTPFSISSVRINFKEDGPIQSCSNDPRGPISLEILFRALSEADCCRSALLA